MGVIKNAGEMLCFLLPESNEWYRKNTVFCLRTAAHAAMLAHHIFIIVYTATNVKLSRLDERFRAMETYAPVLLTGWNMFVCSCFWILFLLDREQVYPKSMDEILPAWLNHGVHTCVLLTLLLELVLQPMREPEDHTAFILLSSGSSVFYAVCYYWVYFRSGYWLYPVFGLMTWWQICLFQLAIWISMHLFYRMQWPISKFIHGTSSEDSESTKAKKKYSNNHSQSTVPSGIYFKNKNDDIMRQKIRHECSKCINECIEFCSCG